MRKGSDASVTNRQSACTQNRKKQVFLFVTTNNVLKKSSLINLFLKKKRPNAKELFEFVCCVYRVEFSFCGTFLHFNK